MSRKPILKKRAIKADLIYNSNLVSMIINKILLKGKKNIAEHIFYESMKKTTDSLQKDPMEVLKKAVKNVTPIIEVKPRRVGGTIYQIPTEVKANRGVSLALRFIVKSARSRPGRGMITKLSNEIIDAYNNTGNSIRKKDDMHKAAEANKAFSNIRR